VPGTDLDGPTPIDSGHPWRSRYAPPSVQVDRSPALVVIPDPCSAIRNRLSGAGKIVPRGVGM